MTAPVEGLVRLGFSEYEAKAYVAMASIGEGGIAEISQQSGIPRSRVYDIMERLAAKGFVVVGATKPLRYRAVEPERVTDQIRAELAQTMEEVQMGLKDLRGTKDKTSTPLWLVQGEGNIDLEIQEFIGEAQQSLGLLAMSKGLLLRHAKAIAEKSRKVKVDVIIVHEPEGFRGLLGRANLFRLPDIKGSSLEWILGVELPTYHPDAAVKSELVLISGHNSLLVYKEEEVRRAIRVEGTIIGRFIYAFADRVIHEARSV